MWTVLLAALAWGADGDLEARLLGPDPATDVPAYGPALPAYGPEPAPTVLEEGTGSGGSEAMRPIPRIGSAGGEAAGGDPLAWFDEMHGRDGISREPGPAGVPWWVPLVALAGAAAFYGVRRQRAGSAPGRKVPDLRVRARTSLGGGAGVAVVEVADGERVRRLVLGIGGRQPVLLTELGTDRTRLPEPLPRRERPVSRRSEQLSTALSGTARKGGGARSGKRSAEPAADWLGDPSPDLGPRKAAARVLIDEALAGRRGPRAV